MHKIAVEAVLPSETLTVTIRSTSSERMAIIKCICLMNATFLYQRVSLRTGIDQYDHARSVDPRTYRDHEFCVCKYLSMPTRLDPNFEDEGGLGFGQIQTASVVR